MNDWNQKLINENNKTEGCFKKYVKIIKMAKAVVTQPFSYGLKENNSINDFSYWDNENSYFS